MMTFLAITTTVNCLLVAWILVRQQKEIMTNDEALAAVRELSTELDTLQGEIAGLQGEILSLQTAAKASSGTISQDLAAAINAVTSRASAIVAQAAVVDNATPDAVGGATDANRNQALSPAGQQPGGGTPATNPPMSATSPAPAAQIAGAGATIGGAPAPDTGTPTPVPAQPAGDTKPPAGSEPPPPVNNP